MLTLDMDFCQLCVEVSLLFAKVGIVAVFKTWGPVLMMKRMPDHQADTPCG